MTRMNYNSGTLAQELGRLLLPGPHVTLTVCTVGGCYDDGEEAAEPVIFDGYCREAVRWLESHMDYVDGLVQEMPDGYILADFDTYSFEEFDVDSLIEELARRC